ncbi:MAG: CdaR family protein [Myxococcales bacterium]|nr:CdaR family protein [Myxococcales bacterium]MDD9965816.1 CdaR family protein [Myxococcales bacterium]
MTVASQRNALVRIAAHNLPLKVLSLALSIALFSIVHSDQDAQRTVFLDVVALLPPPDADKMLLTELPHQVKVTLRGSQARINALERDDFRPIQMDLTDTTRRFHYFESTSVDVGGNVQVVEIQPTRVVLDWADSGERRVPIKPRLDGTVAPGFELKRPVDIQPSSVSLRGPSGALNSITAVYTDVISIEGLTEGTHERRIPLEPLPPHTSYVDDVSVQVVLQVGAKLVERTLARLEVSAVGPGDAVLRPARVSVTVRGPATRIDQLDAEQLVPIVKLDADGGVGTAPARVVVRAIDEVEVVSISPETVLVRRRR